MNDVVDSTWLRASTGDHGTYGYNTSLVVHMGNNAILIGRTQCKKTGLESMSEEHHVKQQLKINK